jgi:fructose-specific phosphotransferase system component IIB
VIDVLPLACACASVSSSCFVVRERETSRGVNGRVRSMVIKNIKVVIVCKVEKAKQSTRVCRVYNDSTKQPLKKVGGLRRERV